MFWNIKDNKSVSISTATTASDVARKISYLLGQTTVSLRPWNLVLHSSNRLGNKEVPLKFLGGVRSNGHGNRGGINRRNHQFLLWLRPHRCHVHHWLLPELSCSSELETAQNGNLTAGTFSRQASALRSAGASAETGPTNWSRSLVVTLDKQANG